MPNMDPNKMPHAQRRTPTSATKTLRKWPWAIPLRMAVNEAKRCLQCKKPACRTGCPVQIDIPGLYCRSGKGEF